MKPRKKHLLTVGAFLALTVGISMILLAAGGDRWALRLLAARLDSLDPAPCLKTDASPTMTDAEGLPLFVFLSAAETWSFPVVLDKVSPWVQRATLAAEDKRFYEHPGVDGRAVLRAAWLNITSGQVRSGASTLTMQLIKLSGSAPEGMRAKITQALAALRLEKSMDKKAIFEAYLNKAPYGGNIVGIEAAARRYFGKTASELTLNEASTLAGLPKSPTILHPINHPERARVRRDQVLQRMLTNGWITRTEYEEVCKQPISAQWHDYPARAPHLAAARAPEIRQRGLFHTTLDGALQARLEEALPRHLRQYDNQIANAAIIVADAQTGRVLARVGSADFNSNAIAGQVDLCRAPRAPGSTLKPFVYALALARQQLYPTEVLLDNSLDYGVYNPANFDGKFNGLLTAGEALRWSLNIPAVLVQGRVGIPETLDLLERLGFDTIRRMPDDYGLGLVLGNCEVRLESLMQAYLALARLGAAIPLTLDADASLPASTQVLPEGVVLALWNMLEQPFPDEPLTNLVRIGNLDARVCWKTGTSTGYHDAWAIAFNAHYVVGAWLGNNDGRASDRLIGAQAALPLVARVFRSLPQPNRPAWPETGNRLQPAEICADTGLPKSPWCPHAATTWLPREQYLHRRCDVHRPGPEGRVVSVWPGASQRWDLANVPAAAPIPLATPAQSEEDILFDMATQAVSESNSPVLTAYAVPVSPASTTRRKALAILSPADQATFVLSGPGGNDRIRLSASKDEQPLHWYHNDRYLGKSEASLPIFLPLSPGEHRVACMDADGQTVSIAFTVLPG